MHQLVKVGIVFALLILGIAAALAFRKPPKDAGAVAPLEGIRPNSPATQEVTVATRSATTDSAQTTEADVVAHKPVGPAESKRKEPAPSTLHVPPPAMSAAFPGSPAASLVPLPRVDQPAAAHQPAPAAAMVDVLDNESSPVRIRRHTIRDGDTLADLASRFLADSARADEIFAANRDVLDDPEILPIGATLSIPIAASTPAITPLPDRADQLPTAVTSQPREISAAGPLVPVEPAQ